MASGPSMVTFFAFTWGTDIQPSRPGKAGMHLAELNQSVEGRTCVEPAHSWPISEDKKHSRCSADHPSWLHNRRLCRSPLDNGELGNKKVH